MLVETTGRYTLDLSPPSLSVLDAVSSTQDSITLAVQLDEEGTVWCAAVLDRQPAPTLNQVIAAGFSMEVEANSTVNVTISRLIRDTEYDTYCFARDDGTRSAKNDTLEVQFSTKNPISYDEVLASKHDAHVIYDSLPPVLVSTDPRHNDFGVSTTPNITLTFNEDVQPGAGVGISLRATGETDILLPLALLGFINREVRVQIGPGDVLAQGKFWSVTIPDGLVVDMTGNMFPGLADGDYKFQTPP